MRIVLVGAVESTAVTLRSLHELGSPPIAVFGLERSLSHRHSDFVDIEAETERLGVPFIGVNSINDAEVVEQIAALRPDWLVVVGWSQICREPLLGTPRVGSIGYHPSPLPELRGRAVLAWTILLDRQTTAGTLFRLAPGVDTGEILVQHSFELAPRETLPTLIGKHMDALRQMWRELWPRLNDTDLGGKAQDESRASYCGKRTADDGLIDWRADAEAIDRLVRAVTKPYPGAFGWLRDAKLTVWIAEPWCGAPHYAPAGQIVAITEDGLLVACGDDGGGGALLVREWQWANPTGKAIRVGDRVTSFCRAQP